MNGKRMWGVAAIVTLAICVATSDLRAQSLETDFEVRSSGPGLWPSTAGSWPRRHESSRRLPACSAKLRSSEAAVPRP